MTKKLRLKVEPSMTPGNGFTIWLDGRWIIDASTFLEEYQLTIDKNTMKKLEENDSLIIYTLKNKVFRKGFKND